MSDKLRQRMAQEAARLVGEGRDIATARIRAARAVRRDWVPENELPTAEEIHAALVPARPQAPDRLDRIAESVRLLATVRHHPRLQSADDGLEHALAVFSTVLNTYPYDEELLTAALLLHAGLVIDRADPVPALLTALGTTITQRTSWLLEAAAVAETHAAGTIGQRARRRFESHPDFEQACLLAAADRQGIHGCPTPPPTLEEAIAILRDLDAEES